MITTEKNEAYQLDNITTLMSCGIFGSRSLKDERVKILILEYIAKYKIQKIATCQEPAGVSEVAQRVCKDLAIPLQLYFLNFKYLRGAFEHRSKDLIRDHDWFLLIHDGVSKGTSNEYALVKKSGKPYIYIVLDKTEYDRSVGFNISQDWGTEVSSFNENISFSESNQ